ncbi:MAG: hypothetical protein ACMUIL_08860 [bacterium]
MNYQIHSNESATIEAFQKHFELTDVEKITDDEGGAEQRGNREDTVF